MDDTTFEGHSPKDVARDISRDIATLLVAHMDGYALLNKNPFAQVDGYPPEHPGSAPIRIDKYLGDAAKDIVQEIRIEQPTLYGATLYQEEEIQLSYIKGEDTRRYRVVVDPLDGSTIYSAFGVGCVSVLVYWWKNPDDRQRREDIWQLQGGCIALNNGYAFTYTLNRRRFQDPFGTVRADVAVSRFDQRPRSRGDYRPVDIINPNIDLDDRNPEGKSTYVLASTAGSSRRRKSIEEDLARHSVDIDFLGSFAANLSVWGAVLGTTSVIIDPAPSTMHDGNYLLVLQALNWIVLDAKTWDVVPLLTIAERHCEPTITREARIPPIYAFRNRAVMERWRESNDPRS
ncbi:hypothetical protein [Mycolicibacterium lutetiense]|uniref:Inositol-phosphate phosphatase n=1 Tax=Mycolicibacterium lutetiense TaxID=1641992 RepID=A0ABS4ZVQ0_9MYCO|nr:hypothetical protein [Mycolicibacterium lutetiense]MBP2452664.1 hypothetical protein [Mycolicibacterium lutetiense]